MPPTLLLFDIDGTLLRTHGASIRAMRKAAARLFGDGFSFDGMSFGGRLDPAIFAEAAQRNALEEVEAHHERFRALYLDELPNALQAGERSPEALPGVHDLLAELRGRVDEGAPLTLGLLSGNYRAAVPMKLASVSIDPEWFTLTAFGDEARTRPDLVDCALGRYRHLLGEPPDPRRVVVIGDTPHDVDCARAHGCVAFAVATGSCDYTELAATRPDVLVEDLSDPAPLLELLE